MWNTNTHSKAVSSSTRLMLYVGQFCRNTGLDQHLDVSCWVNAAANLSGIDHSVLSVTSWRDFSGMCHLLLSVMCRLTWNTFCAVHIHVWSRSYFSCSPLGPDAAAGKRQTSSSQNDLVFSAWSCTLQIIIVARSFDQTASSCWSCSIMRGLIKMKVIIPASLSSMQPVFYETNFHSIYLYFRIAKVYIN